jgi:hypothetical protein
MADDGLTARPVIHRFLHHSAELIAREGDPFRPLEPTIRVCGIRALAVTGLEAAEA